MDTTYVEYDENGEIFHICTVSTTEGDLARFAPISSAPKDIHDTYKQAAQEEIVRRNNLVRDELKAHISAGKKLVVLPTDAPIPQHGRHRVVNGQIKTRTDTEFKIWQDAQVSSNQLNRP